MAEHLFDGEADPEGVDGTLDETSFFVVTTDYDWIQQQLIARPARREEEHSVKVALRQPWV